MHGRRDINNMKSKKAQIMSIELVIITLFMCFTAIMVYSFQMGNFETSIITPVTILEEQDIHELLAIQEKDLLLNSVFGLNWEDDTFRKDAEDNFLENLEKRPDLISNILNNLEDTTIEDNPEIFGDIKKKMSYISDNIYTITYKEGTMTLSRNLLKSYDLRAQNPKKIGFSTTAIIPFNKQIVLTKEDTAFYAQLNENKENP